jgi:hypothetical protein
MKTRPETDPLQTAMFVAQISTYFLYPSSTNVRVLSQLTL